MTSVSEPRRPEERMGLDSIPYWTLHLLALGVFFVPFSWDCVAICAGMYYLRMFGITAGYHRYFAHRGFKTGRVFQFVLAWLGLMSSQKGVLWWSGLHRHHHRYSDMPEDIHSPKRGFWWSHHGWFLCPRYQATPPAQLKEFARYPELLFINRYWPIGPTFLGLAMFALGGVPWLFWGFFLSTVLLWHGTFTINSLAHVWGGRRYATSDTSRNNFILSLVTMGEGWHNNHHHYQSTANQGFFWWEVDASYYLLRALSWLGVVWDLRTPPAWVLEGKTRAHEPAPTPAWSQSVIDAVEAVHALKAQINAMVEGAAELRVRFSERAAELAQAASRAASEAAESAQRAAADLRARASERAAEAQRSAAELRERLAVRAAEASASAAKAAQEASDAASRMAGELKARIAASETAQEASDAASKMASELKARFAASEAAERAAAVAAEAAEAARRAAASVAGLTAAPSTVQ